MKKLKLPFVLFFCTLLIVFSAKAFTGITKVFYLSSLSAGRTSEINARLSQLGYTTILYADPTILTVKNSLNGDNKVFFYHTHGSTTPLLVCSNGCLYPSSITYSSNRLTYLSTCYSAYPANSTSSFRGKMASLGVPMTVGFTGTISAVGSTDGIHYFNYEAFRLILSGYCLEQAIDLAKTRTYNNYGGYYGANTVEYSGLLEELE